LWILNQEYKNDPQTRKKLRNSLLGGWRLLLYLKNPHGGLTQNIRFFYSCFRTVGLCPKIEAFGIRDQLGVCGFGARKAKGIRKKEKVKNTFMFSCTFLSFGSTKTRSGFTEYGMEPQTPETSHARK
jgi:hypothetical protein